ncbi:MAG: DUF4293 family protein [Bacteroidales bacterium]|nr:DUF4293 family protein [Bacteroidales bacterium]
MTWKRIQTLLIGLSAALVFAMLCCPMCFAEVEDPSHPGALVRESIRFTDNLTLTLFAALVLFMHLFTLAFWKRGYVEGKLCIVTLILLVFYQAFIAYWFFQFKAIYTFTIAAVFPLVSAILLGMAYHYISRDVAQFMVDQAFAKRFPKRSAGTHPKQ